MPTCDSLITVMLCDVKSGGDCHGALTFVVVAGL